VDAARRWDVQPPTNHKNARFWTAFTLLWSEWLSQEMNASDLGRNLLREVEAEGGGGLDEVWCSAIRQVLTAFHRDTLPSAQLTISTAFTSTSNTFRSKCDYSAVQI